MERQNQNLPENRGNQVIITGHGNWFNFFRQIKGDDGKISISKLIFKILEVLGAIASIFALIIALMELFGVINIIK